MAKAQVADTQTAPSTAHFLPPELQRVVQALCDTYEAIDLRIETTVGAAEVDFLAAMPEVKDHETELLQLVRLLVSDLLASVPSNVAVDSSQHVLLRFAYQDRDDLVDQLLSGSKARVVVMSADSAVSLHSNIQGISS